MKEYALQILNIVILGDKSFIWSTFTYYLQIVKIKIKWKFKKNPHIKSFVVDFYNLELFYIIYNGFPKVIYDLYVFNWK